MDNVGKIVSIVGVVLDVKFENEIIHVHIKEAQRHFTKNNVINMDFIEI